VTQTATWQQYRKVALGSKKQPKCVALTAAAMGPVLWLTAATHW